MSSFSAVIKNKPEAPNTNVLYSKPNMSKGSIWTISINIKCSG